MTILIISIFLSISFFVLAILQEKKIKKEKIKQLINYSVVFLTSLVIIYSYTVAIIETIKGNNLYINFSFFGFSNLQLLAPFLYCLHLFFWNKSQIILKPIILIFSGFIVLNTIGFLIGNYNNFSVAESFVVATIGNSKNYLFFISFYLNIFIIVKTICNKQIFSAFDLGKTIYLILIYWLYLIILKFSINNDTLYLSWFNTNDFSNLSYFEITNLSSNTKNFLFIYSFLIWISLIVISQFLNSIITSFLIKKNIILQSFNLIKIFDLYYYGVLIKMIYKIKKHCIRN